LEPLYFSRSTALAIELLSEFKFFRGDYVFLIDTLPKQGRL